MPWLCLAAIPLLFELPAIFTSTLIDLRALHLCLDVPLLLTMWIVSGGAQRSALPALALRACALVLVIYRIDQWLCWTLLRDEPLLYDQIFMLRHLWALLRDLMSVRTLLVLLAVGAAAALITLLVVRLLAEARALRGPGARQKTLPLLALAWCVLLVLRATQLGSDDPRVAWLAPQIVANVQRSLRTYASVQEHVQRSPYAAYAKLALRDKPDVLLFIVESYGRLLSVDQGTRSRHFALLSELERQLAAAGFHAVSAFATATVSGGRSWIAEGTIMMGTPIRYEAVFQHIVEERPPSFAAFLNQNGYESALLAPSDRDRAGFHPINRYGFAHLFAYDQLKYPGPAIGWGLVPDQYSLAVVDRDFLRRAAKPVFLDFHMVSSHAPWSEVPELAADPETLFSAQRERAPELTLGKDNMVTPLRRYARGSGRFAYIEGFDAAMREGYRATVEYDLRTITQYLERRDKDAFVIVLGDHQPPVIAREDGSFDTPVHVLSRARERLLPLLENGFVEGLVLPANKPPALGHAGLFSLFVRTLLARHCQDCALPSVLPQGDPLLR